MDRGALNAPWLQPAIEQLRRAREQGRFPAALLVQDVPGGGGALLAETAAAMALCDETAAPCGACRGCRQLAAGQHPDLYVVTPIEESRQIRVEQVRELVERLSLTSHAGGAAVAILNPAEVMNASAANALLKTLEEPRPGTTLILVTTTPSRLPATILSRCLRLKVCVPARAELLSWLRQERGAGDWESVLAVLGDAPLRAATANVSELAQLRRETFSALQDALAGGLDIPATATRWARADNLELRLACIENWITTRINVAVTAARGAPELRNATHLPAAASAMNIGNLIRLYDVARELTRLLPTPVNKAIAVEQLLWLLRAA